MKYSIKYLAILAVLVLFASCSKDLYYSCDPVINKIIKNDVDYYSEISRDEWKQLPDSIQLAAYAAMKPEKKRMFWDEKYQELMQIDWLTLTQADKEHITLLYSYYQNIPDFFNEDYMKNQANKVAFENFTSTWFEYALNNLDWEGSFGYFVGGTGEELTPEIMYATPDQSTLRKQGDGGENVPCKCSKKSDFCSYRYYSAYFKCLTPKNGCIVKPDDCGWLWRSPCDGICDWN
jgi:hypothetical protein